jgi:hypothetical protein
VEERRETTSADDGAVRQRGRNSREWWYPRLVAMGILALGVYGMLSYRHRNDTLRTQRLEIVDARGRVCAVLGAMSDGQTGLRLTGVSGETRAMLTVSSTGNPALMLCNSDGTQRAGLEISPKGQSMLYLLDDNGGIGAAVQVDKGGKSAVKVTGLGGKTEAALTYDGLRSSDVHISNCGTYFDANHNSAQSVVGKRKPRVRVSRFSNDADCVDGRLVRRSRPIVN